MAPIMSNLFGCMILYEPVPSAPISRFKEEKQHLVIQEPLTNGSLTVMVDLLMPDDTLFCLS